MITALELQPGNLGEAPPLDTLVGGIVQDVRESFHALQMDGKPVTRKVGHSYIERAVINALITATKQEDRELFLYLHSKFQNDDAMKETPYTQEFFFGSALNVMLALALGTIASDIITQVTLELLEDWFL
jgi:hypothetical protein